MDAGRTDPGMQVLPSWLIEHVQAFCDAWNDAMIAERQRQERLRAEIEAHSEAP
jgi:hypothetical protein